MYSEKFSDVGLLFSGGLTGLFSVLLETHGGLIVTALSTLVFMHLKWKTNRLERKHKQEEHELKLKMLKEKHDIKMALLKEGNDTNDN